MGHGAYPAPHRHEMPLDGAHARHQPVDFHQELLFVPHGLVFVDRILAEPTPMARIRNTVVERLILVVEAAQFLDEVNLLGHGTGPLCRSASERAPVRWAEAISRGHSRTGKTILVRSSPILPFP